MAAQRGGGTTTKQPEANNFSQLSTTFSEKKSRKFDMDGPDF
jgi:hypothetical protein